LHRDLRFGDAALPLTIGDPAAILPHMITAVVGRRLVEVDVG
jgi:hypothetical protein